MIKIIIGFVIIAICLFCLCGIAKDVDDEFYRNNKLSYKLTVFYMFTCLMTGMVIGVCAVVCWINF